MAEPHDVGAAAAEYSAPLPALPGAAAAAAAAPVGAGAGPSTAVAANMQQVVPAGAMNGGGSGAGPAVGESHAMSHVFARPQVPGGGVSALGALGAAAPQHLQQQQPVNHQQQQQWHAQQKAAQSAAAAASAAGAAAAHAHAHARRRAAENQVHGVKTIGSGRSSAGKRKRRFFTKEVEKLMYGYGDARNPAEETVSVVEDMVCDYIAAVAGEAAENNRMHARSTRGGFRLEDIVLSLKKYPKKHARVLDLLKKDQEIKKARENMKEEEIGEKFKAS